MSLTVSHNMMAARNARILNSHYRKLGDSLRHLSSGLRVERAADDAAGLAIRELMRSDIATLNQGIRNANDAISLIQTADGALAVIDEKLIRMKELAEQAATGTYDSTQREIISREFQTMGAEIDRIAFSTDFNGIKLLDGSRAFPHDGTGLDSWGRLKIHFGTGNDSAEDYYYISMGDASLRGLGLAVGNGRWWDTAVIDYENKKLIYDVSSAVAGLDDGSPMGAAGLNGIDLYTLPIGLNNIKITSGATANGAHKPHVNLFTNTGQQLTGVNPDLDRGTTATPGNMWWNGLSGQAIVDSGIKNGIFSPGAVYDGSSIIGDQAGQSINAGGATITTVTEQNEIKSGAGNDEVITIDTVTNDLVFLIGGHSAGSVVCNHYKMRIEADFDDRFIKNLMGGDTGGAIPINTQQLAQQALPRIDKAIVRKDNVRAHLGAMQNRLENTVTNLEIQAENMQASESRISDTDVAGEMTNFTRNQVLTHTATAMLAQANSLPDLLAGLLNK